MAVRRERGRLGQFDVLVDGHVVASRGGLLRRALGGGFPDPEEVVAAIEARRRARPSG